MSDSSLCIRARAVVHWYSGQSGLKQYEIGNRLGYKNKTNFSQILNGLKPVPSTFPNKLASLDPRINLEYLLGRSDEMLQDPKPPVQLAPEGPSVCPEAPAPTPQPEMRAATKPSGITIPPELATMFADMTATIKSQQELIANLINNQTK